MSHFKRHTECRACKTALPQTPVFSLGTQPLANAFTEIAGGTAPSAPLEILLCPTCMLAQLSVVVDPEILYRDYAYRTSPSETMRRHFGELHTELGVTPETRVVEIGGNDGAMMVDWKASGCGESVIVDPATNQYDHLEESGIRRLTHFFDEDAAALLMEHGKAPDLVVARHVFAHVDKWDGFIRALQILSGKGTTVAIEVPYVMRMLDMAAFDTIYHEHLSYVSIRALRSLLLFASLKIFKVVPYDIHGGSVLVILKHSAFPKTDPSVEDFLRAESVIEPSRWDLFAEESMKTQADVREYLDECNERGFMVCGYGAPAKATVLANACSLSVKHIAFTTDTTPNKQRHYIPGTTIPIIAPIDLESEKPDRVFVFAWNFIDEILVKERAYLRGGGSFVVPIPHLKVHELQGP